MAVCSMAYPEFAVNAWGDSSLRTCKWWVVAAYCPYLDSLDVYLYDRKVCWFHHVLYGLLFTYGHSWDIGTHLSSLHPRREVAALNVLCGFEVGIAWAQYQHLAVTYTATRSISNLEFRYLWNTVVGDNWWESTSSLWGDPMPYFTYGQRGSPSTLL